MLPVAKPERLDYYRILELDQRASNQEIHRAYKRLALRYHPDKRPGAGETTIDINDAFHSIKEAQETLSDPAKRAQYDRHYASLRHRWNMYEATHSEAAEPTVQQPSGPPTKHAKAGELASHELPTVSFAPGAFWAWVKATGPERTRAANIARMHRATEDAANAQRDGACVNRVPRQNIGRKELNGNDAPAATENK